MTDRELLELAAKAAGVHIDDWNFDTPVEYFWDGDPQNPERNYRYWNPLTDDGDALRLAVELRLPLHFPKSQVACDKYWDSSHSLYFTHVENMNDDPYAATRRAIVRAAAEIGKTK